MRNFNLFVAFIAAFAFISCSSTSDKKNVETLEIVENPPVISGVYTNVLPCADCEGIQTTLILNEEMTFQKSTRYLGKDMTASVEEGSYVWNAEDGKIILDSDPTHSPTQYLITENGLRQMDIDGDEIELESQESYQLFNVDNIVNHYWKLTELNGKPITDVPSEPFLVFHASENKLTGNAGCNTLSGYYIIRNGNRIEMPPLAMTMKMCLQMEVERALTQALKKADNYAVLQDTLSLNRARMAPLAKFVKMTE